MDFDSFKKELRIVSEDLTSAIKGGKKINSLRELYISKYEDLIKKSIKSEDNQMIINHLAFNLYASTLTDINFDKLLKIVNEDAKPLITKQQIAYKSLLEVNRELSNKINKVNLGRSLGGKKRAQNQKSHQDLNKIVNEYKRKEEEGYNFNLWGRRSQFYKEMANKYPDISGGEKSIERRIGIYRKKAHSASS